MDYDDYEFKLVIMKWNGKTEEIGAKGCSHSKEGHSKEGYLENNEENNQLK